nr:MAG TPA: hypothetical protein [Caudoviricetes sp.]
MLPTGKTERKINMNLKHWKYRSGFIIQLILEK